MPDPGLDTPHHIHAFKTRLTMTSDAHGFSRHIHTSHELVALLAGEAVQVFGPQRWRFLPGDVFFLPAGSWHIASCDAPARCLVLNFYDQAFTDTHPGDREARCIVDALVRRASSGRPRLELTDGGRRQILAHLETMAMAGEHRAEWGWQCSIKGELLRLLGVLARDATLQVAAEMREVADIDIARIQRIAMFVREHLSEPLPVARLAATAGLSASHFHAIFKRRTGMTVVEYVTQIRMQTAAELLREGTLPIKQVAERCGFPCLSHFYAVFHRYSGRSPAHYAKSD